MAYKTLEELIEMRRNNETNQQHELVEFDNEVDLRDDLPNRFSELQDSNFPLFVSFDKLCSLLEADLFDNRADVLLSPRYQNQGLITFSDFKQKYWPRFGTLLTHGLDAGLVFSEILGVIKCSENNLSKEAYLSSTGYKKSPLLSDVRGRVYDIFEAYMRNSKRWNEIDSADRTRKILQKYCQSPKWQVDYIFVDEVQDHLMVDIHLLQSLCSNPDGGYWCGDTAQTISVGSSFRIKELRAFIHQDLYPKQKVLKRKSRKAPPPFSEFELTVNFRSHGGIVRYAASIVELIQTLFPNAIDHMEPETAKVPGKPPVLFIGSTDDKSEFVHHLLGEKPLNQATPLGAQQAIVVRSKATAQLLNKQMNNNCTVLTILEAKGVEFDDVIIYNFFSESEASILAWKTILELSPKSDDERITYHTTKPLPLISPVLCSELKQLYVAITRARHRCWLWDSGAAIDLMKTFWSGCGLLTISDSLKALAGFAAKPSEPRQWAHRGQQFFSNSQYALAASCFKRAGQDKEAAISDAYHHMSTAKQLQGEENAIEVANFLAAVRMGDQNACVRYVRPLGFSAQLGDLLKLSWHTKDIQNNGVREGSPVGSPWQFFESSQAALGRIQDITLGFLWSNFGLYATPTRILLDKASQLIELYCFLVSLSNGSVREEITFFTLIIKQAHISLNQLDGILPGQGQNYTQDNPLVILGYHYALKRNDWIFEDLSPATIKHLLAWQAYLSAIRIVISMPNPVQFQYVQQLLGLSRPSSASHSNSGLHISRSSVLYSSPSEGQRQADETSQHGDLLPPDVVNQLIKGSWVNQLKKQLETLHHDLYTSNWTQPSWIIKGWKSSGMTEASPTFIDQLHALAPVLKILDLMKGAFAKSFFDHEDAAIGDLWIIRLFNLVFPSTGSCNNLLPLASLGNGSQSNAIIRAWVREAIKSSKDHKKPSVTKIIVCLALAHEIYVPAASRTRILPPQSARFSTAGRPSTLPELFTEEWAQSFQQNPSQRILQLVSVLRHVVEGNRAIDGAVLVHLAEKITREMILAKRVKSPSGNEFSGLIVPASWARSLADHSRDYQCAIERESLAVLLQCVGNILQVLYSGLPDRWKSTNRDNSKHSLDWLIIRLHWSLALVAVNVHSECGEIRLIFDIFRQAKPTPSHESLHNSNHSPSDGLEFNFSKISDQNSALSALRQTIRHEELVILSHRGKPISPAKRNLVNRVIEFRDLDHLCSQL
ncbi:hypothetical protein BDV93DRAFT_561257 [Ceratobasidium sp. AG-I]|nr:hypothetical protein BDV93DRAFT_561257 [Ceratobasidium sp. AG-I]